MLRVHTPARQRMLAGAARALVDRQLKASQAAHIQRETTAAATRCACVHALSGLAAGTEDHVHISTGAVVEPATPE